MTLRPRRQTYDDLVDTDGQRRVVQRTVTLLGKLYKAGQIPAGLMTAFDEVTKAAAGAMGVATEDTHHSTSRLISRYDGMPATSSRALSETIAGQPSWQSPNDRQLDGQNEVKWIADHLPPEMRGLFWACLSEETGAQTGRSLTLTELGQQRGYQSTKQASASGSTQVYDMVAVVAQLRRDYLAEKQSGRVHLKARRNWPAELR